MTKNILHINNNSGFKLPKDYFNELEDKILTKAKLSSIKNSGFKTPDNYFASIENTVLSKLTTKKETPKIISIFTKRNLFYASSIAAAIILMLNVSIFDNKLDFDTLDSATVENYIINEDITPIEIASLLTSKELNDAAFIDFDLTQEHIENYILEHVEIEDMLLE